MRILLLQARNGNDPMLRHEVECFATRCELDPDRFVPLNLAEDAWDDDRLLDSVSAVMVGGSGEYSLAQGGFHWHQHYLDLMLLVVRRKIPTFASCFGFQAIVQALGGEVTKDPAKSEVGTHTIHLSAAGQAEPLFSHAGERFDAQLGHNDSAGVDLPDELVNLAYSDRAPVQAIRVKGAPVIATQFHPELSMDANIVRYMNYLKHYGGGLTDEQALIEAQRIHRPSPISNALLRRFIEQYVTAP